jgi:hypothetical protein
MVSFTTTSAISFIDQAILYNNLAVSCLCRGACGEAVDLFKACMIGLQTSSSIIKNPDISVPCHGSEASLPGQQTISGKIVRCFPCRLDSSFNNMLLSSGGPRGENASGDFDCCEWVFLLDWEQERAGDSHNSDMTDLRELDLIIRCAVAVASYNLAFTLHTRHCAGMRGHRDELALYFSAVFLLEDIDDRFHSMSRPHRKDWSQVHVAALNNIGHIYSTLFDWKSINYVIHKMRIQHLKQIELHHLSPTEGDAATWLEDVSGPIGLLSFLNNVVPSPNGYYRAGYFHSPSA